MWPWFCLLLVIVTSALDSRWLQRGWEGLAAGLNVLYTVLYLQGEPTGFLAAFVGSAIYARICWTRQLIAETLLWVFYVGMATWGGLRWWAQGWGTPPALPEGWGPAGHLCILLLGTAVWWAFTAYLRRNTPARLPGLDAFTTVFSIPATVLMVLWIPEHWYYWLAVNGAGVALYLRSRLWAGAGMYFLYLLLSIQGVLSIL